MEPNPAIKSKDNQNHDLTRRFILFAAAVRQVTCGDDIVATLEVKVTESQADALRFLVLNNDVTISELSIGLGHTISGATKAVNRLEKNGWVKRVSSGDDHRSVYVRLTEQGRDLAEKLLVETERRLSQLLGKLRPETYLRLNDLLEEFLCDFIDDEQVAKKLCMACGFEGGINCHSTDIDCVVAKTIQTLDPSSIKLTKT